MAVGRVMRTERGFTLIEVVLALFLMGVGLMYAAPMFITAVRENASGADIGSVGAIAVDRMEQLRSADFYGLATGGNLTTAVTSFSDTTNPEFTTYWLIAGNGSPATLKTISVRVVAARQVMGLAKEVTLTTERTR